jgi:hypothetical protein
VKQSAYANINTISHLGNGRHRESQPAARKKTLAGIINQYWPMPMKYQLRLSAMKIRGRREKRNLSVAYRNAANP